MEGLVVIGGGQLARCTIEAARLAGSWEVIGFVDPLPCEATARALELERLGGDEALRRFAAAHFVLAFDVPHGTAARRAAVARVKHDRWATIVHPHASISAHATIGPGTIVLAGAIVSIGVAIGAHTVLNTGANLAHDVRVGDFVHIGPQVAVGGGARIEDDCYLGLGALIRDHVTVSEGTMVGMGAVVTAQHPPNVTLMGVPARPRS